MLLACGLIKATIALVLCMLFFFPSSYFHVSFLLSMPVFSFLFSVSLSLSFEGAVEHYRVCRRNNLLTVDQEEYFENLTKLVEVGIHIHRCGGIVSIHC